jgi:hypothetical protein
VLRHPAMYDGDQRGRRSRRAGHDFRQRRGRIETLRVLRPGR